MTDHERELREALNGVMKYVYSQNDFTTRDYENYYAAVEKAKAALAAVPQGVVAQPGTGPLPNQAQIDEAMRSSYRPDQPPPTSAGQLVADDILRCIALRYRKCSVNIYPDLPELTPVEGVLRCAAEEGFVLRSTSQVGAGEAHGPRELAADIVKTLSEAGHLMGENNSEAHEAATTLVAYELTRASRLTAAWNAGIDILEFSRSSPSPTMPPELEALYKFHKRMEIDGLRRQCTEFWPLLEQLHLWLRMTIGDLRATQPPQPSERAQQHTFIDDLNEMVAGGVSYAVLPHIALKADSPFRPGDRVKVTIERAAAPVAEEPNET